MTEKRIHQRKISGFSEVLRLESGEEVTGEERGSQERGETPAWCWVLETEIRECTTRVSSSVE